jgi:hypothetical protein
MNDDLRTSLHRVADRVEPLPVDDDLWHRGVAARRRGQAFVVAAVLAIVVSVAGSVALLGSGDREVRTASQEVPEGAIPSRIDDVPDGLAVTTDLAVGRASVAFISDNGQALVVTARDGAYHALDLPGWDGALLVLSPDGTHLSWTIESDPEGRPRDGFALMDLESGDTLLMSSGQTGSITPEAISWSPSSRWLTWFADNAVTRKDMTSGLAGTLLVDEQVEWAAVNDDGVVTFHAGRPRQWLADRTEKRVELAEGTTATDAHDAATASPDGTTIALSSDATVPAVDFLGARRFEERTLATDLYPDGAAVHPLGWATDTLVLAQVDGPPGSYVEGPHLALFSAPNVPERQWTYRMVARDIPDQELSVAVDLVPDLDGTSSQELTHDFGAADAPPAPLGIELSLFIGLGVAAAIAVLMALRWLWRRLL